MVLPVYTTLFSPFYLGEMCIKVFNKNTISFRSQRNVQEMLTIKFQLKLGAGSDSSHQRGIKRFPRDCTFEKVAKVRRQIMSSSVGETEPISHLPFSVSQAKPTGGNPSLWKKWHQDLNLKDVKQVHKQRLEVTAIKWLIV